MSRDHEKLEVFHDSHHLTLRIYRFTKDFPRDESFGLRAQMRRAAVSVPSNIVEGSAKPTTRDYVKFLNVALGSASELRYLVILAGELDFLDEQGRAELPERCERVVKKLEKLVHSMEGRAASEGARHTQGGSRKPEAGRRDGL